MLRMTIRILPVRSLASFIFRASSTEIASGFSQKTCLPARKKSMLMGACVALGVHRYLSEVSMFGRREEQIKSLGVGFPVTMEPHDIAYDILPEVISRMYTEGVADKVAVYNRVFENYYDTDQAQNPNGHDIMRGLIKARQDYLGIDSLRYIQTSWENIYENMLDRNASTEQLNEVLSYYNAFRKNSGIYLVDQNNSAPNMMFYMRMRQRGGK